MTPQKHSKLYSPSKASIWLQCYLSTVFNDESNEKSSDVAEFGSECHELGSIQISNALGISDYEGNTKSAEEAIKGFKHYDEKMQEIADKYTQFVVSTYEYEKANSKDKPLVLIEQQLDLGFDDDSTGTLDLGIISDRNGGTLTIIDLKTGHLPISSFDKELNKPNPQLTLYSLATYKCFKDVYPIKNIRLVIYQPVINNTNEYEMKVDELLAFEKDIVEPAVKAIKSGDRTAKENSKCKYCPGLVYCKKKLDSARNLVNLERNIDTLTEEEIAEILPKCDDYIAYFEKVKEHCLKKAIKGQKYTRFKLVHSRVTRKIIDEGEVAKTLEELGYSPYQTPKLLGITELTRILGKDKFKELVSPYISLQEGSLILVPDSDGREEVIITEDNENAKN